MESSWHLPDEIIKEILTPALQVPDEIFSDTGSVSPFATYDESTSALLVVCKSWLRVSTPLLYNVVVLRSKAQAQALARSLCGNKLLGTFIKKLRLEGSFGPSIEKIVNLAPNITDLCLTLNIWSSDSVSGIRRAFPKMNPRRLVICDSNQRHSDNNPGRELCDALLLWIRTWNQESLIGGLAHRAES
ncbi:hypothetical protein H0H81_010343 [Sphagnurus paluster]|uniref:F-box domain-containing protein n=1 Tax=Sphagnurus paluster TaxID=117069 RepID=A0A9P7GM05_9AGAR|nr:hypothetical protein H0H81_010343 [Sphagnurus paluster]